MKLLSDSGQNLPGDFDQGLLSDVDHFQLAGVLASRAARRAGMHTSRLPASLSKAGRRLGSAKRAEYSALFEARLRLYQRRFLRPRPHFSAFFKLYMLVLCTIPDFCDFSSLRTIFFFKI